MGSKKRAMKFQNANTKRMTIRFWIGIIIMDILLYIINWYNASKMDEIALSHRMNLSVAGANLFPILIFLVVYSYKTYCERFPTVLSFNVTRKNFYETIIVDNIIVAFIFALIQGIIFKIDSILINLIGRKPIFDFKIFNTNLDNIFFIVSSIFLVILTSVAIMNLASLLSYKFRRKIWIGFLIFYVMISEQVKGVGFEIPYSIGNMLNIRMDLNQASKLVITIMICYVLGYINIRKTNIKYNKE